MNVFPRRIRMYINSRRSMYLRYFSGYNHARKLIAYECFSACALWREKLLRRLCTHIHTQMSYLCALVHWRQLKDSMSLSCCSAGEKENANQIKRYGSTSKWTRSARPFCVLYAGQRVMSIRDYRFSNKGCTDWFLSISSIDSLSSNYIISVYFTSICSMNGDIVMRNHAKFEMSNFYVRYA